MSVSIREVADSFQKNTRTVRRWCERGFVPGAYRTKGGRWRLSEWNIRVRDAVKANIEGFARERNAFKARFRHRRIACIREALGPFSVDGLARNFDLLANKSSLREIEARIAKVDPESPEFDEAVRGTPFYPPDKPPDNIDEAEQAERDALADARTAKAVAGAQKNPPRTALALAAEELAVADIPRTVQNLCRQLRISKATFYRRYTSKMRKEAVAAAMLSDAAEKPGAGDVASYLKEQAESLPAKPTKNL